MSRATVAQRQPDTSLEWARFPKRTLKPGTLLYRAARRKRSPWWFCNCGDCRFDLPGDRGTCYTGTDAVSGLLETLGPELAEGAPLTPDHLRKRTVHALLLAEALPVADLVSRRAVSFRITNELSTMTPYETPQAFARVFDEARNASGRVLRGIRFRTRFDTGAQARGVALFDHAGLRDLPSDSEEEVDERMFAALRTLGIVIENPPTLNELELVPDPG